MAHETVFVKKGPDQAQSQWQKREKERGETDASLRAGGEFSLKGAERDAGVSHARRGAGEDHKQRLIRGADGQHGEARDELDCAQAG